MRIRLPVCLFVLLLTQIGTEIRADCLGDPVVGKRQFAQCGACHATEVEGPNKIGPNLHGIFGLAAIYAYLRETTK
jgi:cytochrome c